MRIRALAVGIVWTACLCGQSRKFNWQNYCFDHPAAIVCSGHEYAVKPPPKGASPRTSATNAFPPTQRAMNPSVIVVGGGIDWRFADPFADGLIGLNLSGRSPIARDLIVQLGTKRGFAEANMNKIFDGLSGVSQIVLSVRDNQVLAMITGSKMDLAPAAQEAGLKTAPVSQNAMLAGHADAVDLAVQRLSMKDAPPEMTKLVDELQAGSEFWVVGSAALAGPEAVSAGVKRFSMAVSIRNQVTTDVVFEFNDAPDMNKLKTWQTTLGAAMVEGNRAHFRMSMEAGEAREKLGLGAEGPLGQRMAGLFEVAKYFPASDAAAPKNKPVIYGLDAGPKEVNQLPSH